MFPVRRFPVSLTRSGCCHQAGSLAARRRAGAYVRNQGAVTKLFNDLAERYKCVAVAVLCGLRPCFALGSLFIGPL